MLESILVFLIKLEAAKKRLMPIGMAYWFGRWYGRIAYVFSTKKRRQAMHNLKIAFGKDKTYRELCKLCELVFEHFGENLIDLFLMPKMNKSLTDKYVQLEGRENIDNALKKGKGVIYLASHSGSWEMSSLVGSRVSDNYRMLLNPQSRYPKIHRLLMSYRHRAGIKTLTVGKDSRKIIKELKNNSIISIILDNGGKEGQRLEFFGQSASMSIGALKLALKHGTTVLPVHITRLNGPYQKLVVHEPIKIKNSGDKSKDLTTTLKGAVSLLESNIRKKPDEYLWFYKIWKYSNEANIAVLYDDRVGHTRQSQVMANKIKDALAERNITGRIVEYEVKYKSKRLAKDFSLYSRFAYLLNRTGRLNFLRRFLVKESFSQIATAPMDVVVSTGSSLAGVNYFLAKDVSAKSVVLLKPGLLSYDWFDKVILPQHDVENMVKKPSNIIKTTGAPNLINDSYLKEQAALLENRFSHLKSSFKTRIGVFIGGPAKNIHITEWQIRTLIYQLKEVASQINAEILLTTSRRTPKKLEKILHHEMKKYKKCPLLILANQENVPEAVGGIMGLSDMIVVSGDSISMVSEAASSGKGTIVFSAETKLLAHKVNKYWRFIDNLNRQGYILSTNVQNVGQSVYSLAKGKVKTRRLDDGAVLLNTARDII